LVLAECLARGVNQFLTRGIGKQSRSDLIRVDEPTMSTVRFLNNARYHGEDVSMLPGRLH
jgi:hypothetical protein